jgi:hypothetical protein
METVKSLFVEMTASMDPPTEETETADSEVNVKNTEAPDWMTVTAAVLDWSDVQMNVMTAERLEMEAFAATVKAWLNEAPS